MIHVKSIYRGLGSYQPPRQAARRTVTLEGAFEAGRRAAERGCSRGQCGYSDPLKFASWLKGFDSWRKS